MKKIVLGSSLLFLTIFASGQSKMDFEKYDPPSQLVVPEHKITKSKFPFIDVHNHQFGMASQNLNDLVKDMDKLNMAVMVNLSGQNGDVLKKAVTNVKAAAPKRFIVFANINFDGIGESGWIDK